MCAIFLSHFVFAVFWRTLFAFGFVFHHDWFCRLYILDENRREFYAEGHRWFDIKRIGLRHHSADFPKWIDKQYSEWNGRDFLMYWPIPQDERDKAGGAYTQNPGYSGAEQ